jgi:hypothetical protein
MPAIVLEQEQEQELDGNLSNCTEFTQLVHCENDPHLSHLLLMGCYIYVEEWILQGLKK